MCPEEDHRLPGVDVNAVYNSSETVTDEHRAIGQRRLQSISTALGLAPNEFEQAHKAMLSAMDGGHDRILSEQRRQIVGALPDIADPMIRARVVELFVNLVSD